MKKYILFILLSTSFIACKSDHKHNADGSHESSTDAVELTSKEYTSKYICPMHCKGSGSDKIGTCSTCGMDYVVNDVQDTIKNGVPLNPEEHDHDGHDHDGHDHDGHNH
jgi:hypothetical protein